jgi:hypothetical protein
MLASEVWQSSTQFAAHVCTAAANNSKGAAGFVYSLVNVRGLNIRSLRGLTISNRQCHTMMQVMHLPMPEMIQSPMGPGCKMLQINSKTLLMSLPFHK